MDALVIGGTGPTGPDVVAALLERSFTVTVLHRGLHEPDEEVLRRVEHIHADPHFAQPLCRCPGRSRVRPDRRHVRANACQCRGLRRPLCPVRRCGRQPGLPGHARPPFVLAGGHEGPGARIRPCGDGSHHLEGPLRGAGGGRRAGGVRGARRRGHSVPPTCGTRSSTDGGPGWRLNAASSAASSTAVNACFCPTAD